MVKIVKPESELIEHTAMKLATAFYEAGRSQGLTSKYKDAKGYALRHVKEFTPLAINYLMDMLGKSSTPQDQKDAIYDAIMERTNDVELSNNTGIPVFANPLANTFKPDWKDDRKPLMVSSKPFELSPMGHGGTIEELPLERMLNGVLLEEKKSDG